MNIKLEPIKKDTADKTLQKWLGGLANVAYDQTSVTDDLAAILDKGKGVVDNILAKVQNSERESVKLTAGDGR